jgi:hypothetical protein
VPVTHDPFTTPTGGKGGASDMDDGFRRATGLSYRKFFRRLHRQRLFDWYLEIGCRSGGVFRSVRSKTIAVDPFFKITDDVLGEKPELHIMQKTSDAFFASGFLDAHGIRLSVSFIDGMHLFEYLLRDFMNAERSSSADGVIVMHDCCPFGYAMCTRDLDNLLRGAWTGDVWKILPILREVRPDLRIDVLDCPPTGLVVVSGLDPDNRALFDAYDKIVDDWRGVTLETWGLDRFNAQFSYVDALEYLGSADVFDKVTLDPASHVPPRFASP